MVTIPTKLKAVLDFANRQRVFIGLIIICAVFGARNPAFVSAENLLNVLTQASPIALASIGMTFVILRGGIDLSVGSVVALTGLVFGFADLHGFPIFVSIVVAVVAGLVCGTVSGVFIAIAKVPAFVATLGMMSAARGISLFLTDGRSLSGFSDSLLGIAGSTRLGLPLPIVVLLLALVIGHVFLNYMVGGRRLYAVGGNSKAAWLCGVNVPFYTVFVYAVSGGCAGLASVILASRLNSAHPLAGSLYELDAIAAVVIGGGSLRGGKATMVGTLLGVLLLAVLKNGLSILNVSPYAQQVAVGAILVITATLDAYGSRQSNDD